MPIHQPPRNYRPAKVSRDRFANPYFKARQADKVSASRFKNFLAKIPPRAWLTFFAVLILAGGLIWLGAFSSVFLIKEVNVQGTIESEQKAVRDIVWWQSEGNRLWLLPQNRLFVFDKSALERTLTERYALDGLAIHKRLPGKIKVLLTEKVPVATWFEADAYYLIDREGWVIRSLSAPQPGLPAYYNNGPVRLAGKQVQGQANALAQSHELWELLGGRFANLNYRQIVVDNDRETVKVVLRDGAILLLATDQPLAGQFDRLEVLLSGDLRNKLTRLSYIDLRYGDKVYYK